VTIFAIATLVGRILIFLTFIISADGAWRRRETHRLDILALVVLAGIGSFRQPLGSVGMALLLIRVYVLVRLVQHFRDVPVVLRRGTLVAIVVGTAINVVWHEAQGRRPAAA
jgi:hypothetical protein